MEKHPVMKADHLAIGYRTNKRSECAIHRDLNFMLYAGEMTCLLGPNGVGKSTLLRTLACFQPALSGELLFEGRPIGQLSERELSRKIGVVLTDKTQVGGLTVYELVSLGRQPHTGFFGRLKADDHRLIREAIESVGIAHKAQSYVAELSDGEKQKAMIAKALVQECPLILLDEPTAFLDVVSRIEIMQLLHTIAHQQGRTVLLSTHDVEQAFMFADKLWLLSPSEGLHYGVTEDIVFDGSMERLFPGQSIRFDHERGGYMPVPEHTRSLLIEATDPLLCHWLRNALARDGFTGITAASSSATMPVLKANTPEDMTLELNGQSHHLRSFSELHEALEAIPLPSASLPSR